MMDMVSDDLFDSEELEVPEDVQGATHNSSNAPAETDAELLSRIVEDTVLEGTIKTQVEKIIGLKEQLTEVGRSYPSIEQFLIDVENRNRSGKRIDEFHNDIVRFRADIQDLKNGRLTPRRIIGVGGTRPAAVAWLENSIAKSMNALKYKGFGYYINISNYAFALNKILTTGIDSTFVSDEENARKLNEQKTLEKEAEIKRLALSDKATKYRTLVIGDFIKHKLASRFTHNFTINYEDEPTIVKAAEAGSAHEVVEYLKSAPGAKAVGEMELNKTFDLRRSLSLGVKYNRVEFKPRKGYVLIEVEIDLGEYAKHAAMESNKGSSKLASNPSVEYSMENLPLSAINLIERSYQGKIETALQHRGDTIRSMIDNENFVVKAKEEFAKVGYGLIYSNKENTAFVIHVKRSRGDALYQFDSTKFVRLDNFTDSVGAIKGAAHNFFNVIAPIGTLKTFASDPAWILNAENKYQKTFIEDMPDYLPVKTEQAEVLEKHYSEQIIDRLVEVHNWVRTSAITADKDVGGSENTGELNPTGSRIVNATFAHDGRYRYLTLDLGFSTVFDVDCRDAGIVEAAKYFDSKTTEWAIKNAQDKATLKVAAIAADDQITSGRIDDIRKLADKYSEMLGTETREYHTNVATAIYDKNFCDLEILFNGVNGSGAKLFFDYIGKKTPKSQSAMIDSALEYCCVDKHEYEISQAKQRYLSVVNRYKREFGVEGQKLIEWADQMISTGYCKVEKIDRETWLVNPETGRGFNLSKHGMSPAKELMQKRIELQASSDANPKSDAQDVVLETINPVDQNVDAYLNFTTRLRARYKQGDILLLSKNGTPTKYTKLEIMAAVKYLGMDAFKMIDKSKGIDEAYINSLFNKNLNIEVKKVVVDEKAQANEWFDRGFAYKKNSGEIWVPDFSKIDAVTGDELLPYIELLTDRNMHAEAAMLRAKRVGSEELYSLASDYQEHVSINRAVLNSAKVQVDKLQVLLGGAEANFSNELLDWTLRSVALLGEIWRTGDSIHKKPSANIWVERIKDTIKVTLKGVEPRFVDGTENDVVSLLATYWPNIKGQFLAATYPGINSSQATSLSDYVVKGSGQQIAYGYNTELLGDNILIRTITPESKYQLSILNASGEIIHLEGQQEEKGKSLLTALHWNHHFTIQSQHMAVVVANNLVLKAEKESKLDVQHAAM